MVSPDRRLSLVAVFGISCLGLTTLILNFLPTGYSPIKQAVSDYGVGRFGAEMAIGFFAGGVGLASLGFALAKSVSRRVEKTGAVFLLVAGVSLVVVGVFPTDLEGASATLNGAIHSVVSQFVFIFGPAGMILVSYANGRTWLGPTLSGLLFAGGFFAADVILSLQATGLAERIFIIALLTWWFVVAMRLLVDS